MTSLDMSLPMEQASQCSDTWTALIGLHTTTDPGEQMQLCGELLAQPLQDVEQVLLQLTYVAVEHPSSALERAIIELCARSLRIAVKASWLLLALSQDQPHNQHIALFREKCARAALEGAWALPFPHGSFGAAAAAGDGPAGHGASAPLAFASGQSFRRSVELPQPPDLHGSAPDIANRTPASASAAPVPPQAPPAAPDGEAGSQPAAGALAAPHGAAADASAAAHAVLALRAASGTPSLVAHAEAIQEELGEGEGVTALLLRSRQMGPSGVVRASEEVSLSSSALLDQPASPTTQLRRDTYGATLDFLDALCEASSNLVRFPQSQRLEVLRACLERINTLVEGAGAGGVPIWWPLSPGGGDRRVLRLCVAESVLLNSRDKAPFMLTLETMLGGSVSGDAACGAAATEATPLHSAAPVQRPPPRDAHAPPAPHERRRRREGEREGSPADGRGAGAGAPVGASAAASGQVPSGHAAASAGAAATEPVAAGDVHEAPPLQLPVPRAAGAVQVGAKSEVERRMDAALALLRGEAPLVHLRLEVPPPPPPTPPSGAGDSEREGGPAQRLVCVHLEVAAAAAVDLRTAPLRRGRRVPSSEMLGMMADRYHVVTIPEPAEVGPQAPPPPGSAAACDAAAASDSFPAAGPAAAAPAAPRPGSRAQAHGGATASAPASARSSDSGASSPPAVRDVLGRMLSAPLKALVSAVRRPTSAGGAGAGGSALRGGTAPPPPGPASAAAAAAAAAAAKQQQAPIGALAQRQRAAAAAAVYGEPWERAAERLRRASPDGARPGWGACSVIVKSGDDCRQELLALQLIAAFRDIWADAGLPLWVRPFGVVVTSNTTALIEVVHDALSIHSIKARSPLGTTLADHFFDKWGRGSAACIAAQRRFTESLAGYSLITYLLQVKDRHNGNIMLDTTGRLVHIDFGFLLSNFPGGVNFEAAPFKLTREYLEIMNSNSEGAPSDLFDYFKVLLIQGFLCARKQCGRITELVDVMARSGLPCLKAGPERAVAALARRFACDLPEAACVEHVLALTADAMDAWRTRQYDQYQRVLNGIL